ncbi:hypothetical protein [Shimazuella kribbensis]|uniref:hypothetical protein n=1 Tax=Shimazuella kribbensis TaxID=139808 RepID=UPI00048F777D|nr:hypothetical protein [Shimazuella kribbensis]
MDNISLFILFIYLKSSYLLRVQQGLHADLGTTAVGLGDDLFGRSDLSGASARTPPSVYKRSSSDHGKEFIIDLECPIVERRLHFVGEVIPTLIGGIDPFVQTLLRGGFRLRRRQVAHGFLDFIPKWLDLFELFHISKAISIRSGGGSLP